MTSKPIDVPTSSFSNIVDQLTAAQTATAGLVEQLDQAKQSIFGSQMKIARLEHELEQSRRVIDGIKALVGTQVSHISPVSVTFLPTH
jgi:hypothetical protein